MHSGKLWGGMQSIFATGLLAAPPETLKSYDVDNHILTLSIFIQYHHESKRAILRSHTTFWKSITKVTPFSNKCPILHRDSISFHLSYQPPLSVMCNFYVVKMSLLGGKVSLLLHKK